MKCLHCQGEMAREAAPFHLERKGIQLTLQRVPAWVCGQCGEPFFEAPEVEAIQQIIRAIEGPAEKLAESA